MTPTNSNIDEGIVTAIGVEIRDACKDVSVITGVVYLIIGAVLVWSEPNSITWTNLAWIISLWISVSITFGIILGTVLGFFTWLFNLTVRVISWISRCVSSYVYVSHYFHRPWNRWTANCV